MAKESIKGENKYKEIMYIKVRVIPGSKKESFKKVSDDTYRISVKEKAEMNMANNRVKELLAYNLNILPNNIRLISGHHSPSKIFSITLHK